MQQLSETPLRYRQPASFRFMGHFLTSAQANLERQSRVFEDPTVTAPGGKVSQRPQPHLDIQEGEISRKLFSRLAERILEVQWSLLLHL